MLFKVEFILTFTRRGYFYNSTVICLADKGILKD